MSSEAADDRLPVADQFECTERLLAVTPKALVVSNLGVASYVLAGVEDRDRNFYQWGSMGVTTSVGLGLALSTDEQVTVLEGDGSLLMSLGVLSTVASYDPENLVIALWDNSTYATTGGQRTHSATTDFAAAARSCGLEAVRARSNDEFEDAYRDAVAHDGAVLLVCEVADADPEARPPFDFAHIKRRVRDSLAESDE